MTQHAVCAFVTWPSLHRPVDTGARGTSTNSDPRAAGIGVSNKAPSDSRPAVCNPQPASMILLQAHLLACK